MTHLWCILVPFGAYYTVSAYRNSSMVTISRCGDGVSVVMTVPHRVELI